MEGHEIINIGNNSWIGIYLANSTIIAQNIIFNGGSSTYGGAIRTSFSVGFLENLDIYTTAASYGSALSFEGGQISVDGCYITDSTAYINGGGMSVLTLDYVISPKANLV